MAVIGYQSDVQARAGRILLGEFAIDDRLCKRFFLVAHRGDHRNQEGMLLYPLERAERHNGGIMVELPQIAKLDDGVVKKFNHRSFGGKTVPFSTSMQNTWIGVEDRKGEPRLRFTQRLILPERKHNDVLDRIRRRIEYNQIEGELTQYFRVFAPHDVSSGDLGTNRYAIVGSTPPTRVVSERARTASPEPSHSSSSSGGAFAALGPLRNEGLA